MIAKRPLPPTTSTSTSTTDSTTTATMALLPSLNPLPRLIQTLVNNDTPKGSAHMTISVPAYFRDYMAAIALLTGLAHREQHSELYIPNQCKVLQATVELALDILDSDTGIVDASRKVAKIRKYKSYPDQKRIDIHGVAQWHELRTDIRMLKYNIPPQSATEDRSKPHGYGGIERARKYAREYVALYPILTEELVGRLRDSNIKASMRLKGPVSANFRFLFMVGISTIPGVLYPEHATFMQESLTRYRELAHNMVDRVNKLVANRQHMLESKP